MMTFTRLACVAAALALPGLARAEPDDSVRVTAPSRAASVAHPNGWFYLRAGGALVAPISSSRELELADVDGPASLAVQNGPIHGSGAKVDSATIIAGTLGWILPTDSRRWSLELVLGKPLTVTFEATGTLATTSIAPMALGLPTGVGPLGTQLGEATTLPIVITSIYQLSDSPRWRPYVGGGPALLLTQKAKVTNPMLTEVGHPDLQISPAPGLAVQAGIDVQLWRSIYARLDAKFIALRAHAEVHHIEVKTPGIPLFESVEVGTAKMDVWVNPVIVIAGVGVDFDIVDVYHSVSALF